MPSYADATTDFPVYGLPAGVVASFSTPNVQKHLDAASGFAFQRIQSRDSGQIDGPPYPPILVQWVCEIASYTILKTIGFNPETPNDLAVLEAHDRARGELNAIAEGRPVPWTPVDPVFEVGSDPSRGWYPPSGRIR